MNVIIDWNEYFIALCALGSVSVYLLIRKHFHPVANIMIWIFTISLVELFDYALATTPFQAYYCGDNTSYEPATGILQFLVYPPYSFIFLYFYDKWKLRGGKLILYILGWTGFSVWFEWICVLNGVFTYTGWSLYYSVLVYPISDLLIIKLHHFINKHLDDPLPDPKFVVS